MKFSNSVRGMAAKRAKSRPDGTEVFSHQYLQPGGFQRDVGRLAEDGWTVESTTQAMVGKMSTLVAVFVRKTAQPAAVAAPILSPDGFYWWTGTAWQAR